MDRCEIGIEQIADYRVGNADEVTSRHIEKHLAEGCLACRQNIAWLERVLPAMHYVENLRAIERSSALEAAVEQVMPVLWERFGRPKRPSILASLLFDSRIHMIPGFARGERGETSQQIYSTVDYSIELWQERLSKDRWYLIGQVLPRDGGDTADPESVTLTPTEGDRLTAFEHQGEFHVPSIGEDTYEIRVCLPDAEIVLPGVTIGD